MVEFVIVSHLGKLLFLVNLQIKKKQLMVYFISNFSCMNDQVSDTDSGGPLVFIQKWFSYKTAVIFFPVCNMVVQLTYTKSSRYLILFYI